MVSHEYFKKGKIIWYYTAIGIIPLQFCFTGKNKELKLDVKTRWSSLIEMLRRFYEAHVKIRKAMDICKKNFDLSYAELELMKELIDVLSPLEYAVKILCSNSATLLTAEKSHRICT